MAQYSFARNMLTANDSGPRALSSIVGNVIHTTENSGRTTAMDIAAWLQRREAQASYTGLVDKFRNTVRSNDDNYIPWSVGSTKGNGRFLHYAVVGEAKYSRETWLGEYRPALEELAKILAHNNREYGIPLRLLTQDQLRRLEKGTSTHNDCSKVFGGSDHWDPGPGFPLDWVIDQAKNIVNGTPNKGATVSQNPQMDRVHHELTHEFQSRVEGSQYRDTLVGYMLNTDAAAYRLEIEVAEMRDQLDRIEKMIGDRK